MSACGKESSRVGFLPFEREDPRRLVSTVDNWALRNLRRIARHNIVLPQVDAYQRENAELATTNSELGNQGSSAR
jgi:hypothetical protein